MTQQSQRVEATEADVRREAAPDDLAVVLEEAVGRRRFRAMAPRSDLVLLSGLVVVTAFVWGRAAGMALWLDEGISVGVASHPLRSIPSVLLRDGSPPLYYLLLHWWTSLFGSSDSASHTLSLLFAVALVPAAFWSGRTLFGRRTGWTFALLVALNPFLAYYATETRMYSLAALLGLLSTATFLHAFVFGRRRYLPAFVVCQALLMYAHNWGILVGVGLGAAAVACFFLVPDRRRVVVDAALAFGAVAVLYLPWLPSLAYQAGQHLQPWGRKGDLIWVRDDVARALGGYEASVALVLGAGVGILALVQRGWRSRNAVAVAALGLVCAVTLAAGWRGSVWAYRYLAVVVPPILLMAAVGLARGGQVAVAALAAVAFLAGPFAVKGPAYQKSNAKAVADEVGSKLRPGDLVVLPDFEMVPLFAHYLPGGLRYATTSGAVPDANVVDWRHSMQRLQENDPQVTLPPLIDSLPVGGHVLVACPPRDTSLDSIGLSQGGDAGQSATTRTRDVGTGTGTGTGATGGGGAGGGRAEVTHKTTPSPGDVLFHPLIFVRCDQTDELLLNHPGLRIDEVLKAPTGVRYTPVDARLVTKVPAATGR